MSSRSGRPLCERTRVADIPDRIVLKRHRDLDGVGHRIWVRRSLLALLAAFLVIGLFNVFGQRPHGDFAESAEAKLELYAPAHLRGGLLYEARFTITAHQDIKNAALQLSPGWLESQQLNTIEPSPLGEASRNGDLLMTLGHIAAGTKYRLFMQFQVNPTNVGSRVANVTLYDGGTKLLHIDRTITVFP
jgi:hypothetical protein